MRLKAKVMFYCHYPDKLLAPKGGLLRRLYRFPPPPYSLSFFSFHNPEYLSIPLRSTAPYPPTP